MKWQQNMCELSEFVVDNCEMQVRVYVKDRQLLKLVGSITMTLLGLLVITFTKPQ